MCSEFNFSSKVKPPPWMISTQFSSCHPSFQLSMAPIGLQTAQYYLNPRINPGRQSKPDGWLPTDFKFKYGEKSAENYLYNKIQIYDQHNKTLHISWDLL